MTIAQLDPLSMQFIEKTLGTPTFEVIQLAGDASSRRYYRIVHAEQSLVLMVWEPFVDDGRYPFLNVLNHFEKHGVLVPKVVGKAPQLGLVLLEDLGDLTLERKFWENQNQSNAIPYYKQAIDELIKIHYPASMDRTTDCVAFKVAFNTEKLLWEMNYGRDHLLEKLCGIKLSPATRQELESIFVDVCSALDREEKIICHRDYHSRNVMIKHGKTRVIDFQDARLGAMQYDLVSLTHDSYVNLNDASRGEILDYYLARAKEYRTTPIARDSFYSVFRLQMIQRCFKACGSFASFYNMREDTRYLKYLEPTIKKVAEALEQYPQYSTFLNLIRDNGLLETNFEDPTHFKKNS
jgi:aminoglycoside/choline kinase family phosphotransferase